MNDDPRRGRMIAKIIECCKANNVPVTGDMFLAMAFLRTETLAKICQHLHIRVDIP